MTTVRKECKIYSQATIDSAHNLSFTGNSSHHLEVLCGGQIPAPDALGPYVGLHHTKTKRSGISIHGINLQQNLDAL